MQKALEKNNEALPINRAVGDRSGEAITLANIGLVYRSLGEMQKALEKYNEALPISPGGRRPQRGGRLHSTTSASVYRSLGETQKALEKYNEALPINRAIGRPQWGGRHTQQHRQGLSVTGRDAEGAGEVQ